MKVENLVSRKYDLYKDWFVKSLDIIWQLPPDLRAKADPVAEIDRAEVNSRSRAINSLSRAVKDTISMTDRYSPELVRRADDLFINLGLPSLTEMKLVFSKQLYKVINQQKLNNDEEYYIAKTVEDLDVAEELKHKARQLYGDYEIERMGK